MEEALAEQRVEAVERALSLLDSFREGDDGLTLAELADRTGHYKSTILRLAASLERFGYLVRGGDGRFRLGPSLARLGSLYRLGFTLGDHLRPELRRLSEATGETASYYVREGDSRVCLYRVNSPRAARHHLNEGDRLPMVGGASAHVLRAWSGDAAPADSAIRDKGFALSLGERDPDIAAVALPLLDRRGGLRGALAVSGLIARFDARRRDAALGVLRDSAGRLLRALP